MLLHRCAVFQQVLMATRAGRQPAIALAITTRQARSFSSTRGALCPSRTGKETEASLLSPLRWTCAAKWSLSRAVPCAHYSSGGPAPPGPAAKQSSTARVKVVIKEYGGVAVVFHTVISLCSLGTCYLIVSRSELDAPYSHTTRPFSQRLWLNG